MRTWMTVGLLAVALAVPALAQREPGAERPERPGPGRQGRGANGAPFELTARLADILSLTEEQRPQYDAIVEKYKPRFDAQAAEMRQLAEQLRAAREANDETKTEELRQKLDDLREAQRPVVAEFLNEVKPLLTPEQLPRFNEFRDRMDRERGGPGSLELLIARLPEELQFTEQQQAQFKPLVDAYRAQQRELQPLVRQLWAAQRERDEARVAELEKEIQAKRGAGDPGIVFLDKVAPLLKGEQKSRLEELWVRYTRGVGPSDARVMLQEAERLGLDESQQKRWRELAHETWQAARAEQKPEQAADFAAKLRKHIEGMLNDEQKAQFEQALERAQRPGPGRGPGMGQPRPERRGREGDQP